MLNTEFKVVFDAQFVTDRTYTMRVFARDAAHASELCRQAFLEDMHADEVEFEYEQTGELIDVNVVYVESL